MSETVKLIIEIPKEDYELARTHRYTTKPLFDAVVNGIPLDDVKAEIEQIHQEIDTVSHSEYENAVEQGKEIAYENSLSILDNIGKGDKNEE